MRRLLALLAFGSLACAATPTPTPASSPTPPATVPESPPSAEPASAPPRASAPAKSPPPAPPDRFGGAAFPPADVPPPQERSAQPGDGKWVRMGDAAKGEVAAEEPAVLYRATVHPHRVSKWKSVTAVAIDLKHASLHLVAGTKDPESDSVPEAERSGLVAPEHQPDLVAAFNGGWQTRHGHWGMMADGRVFVPPREEGCTIAIFRDNSVRIAPWTELSGSVGEMVAYRQTPPCLLEKGELHPKLAARVEAPWGGQNPKIKTRRRSAIAIDASGRVLMYGFSEEASARELAEGLKTLGASAAAELDINYYWTRFLLFGKPKADAPPEVTSTLVKMQHRRAGYVRKPEPRDFFYVKRERP
jgi:hypothetical protein